VVYKNGDVMVNGKKVATGARAIGRENMPGSVKSGSVWERPTLVSFNSDSIPAFVNMENGTFHYFIIKSCGNAGKATPVKKPTPTPVTTPIKTPVKTPTPTPKTPTPKPKTPTPTPTPKEEGKVLGTTLPQTGPEAALGGMIGLTGIGVASRAYLRSRKDLKNSLRKQK